MKRALIVSFVLTVILVACTKRNSPQSSQNLSSSNATTEQGSQINASNKGAQTPEAQGELLVEDITVGSGAEAKTGDFLRVNYVGRLEDGVQFDSSYEYGKPFNFPLGQGKVIAGWDQGVLGMKVGGKRKLVIPSHLGYGIEGVGNVIPPNATLIFEIELLEIISK